MTVTLPLLHLPYCFISVSFGRVTERLCQLLIEQYENAQLFSGAHGRDDRDFLTNVQKTSH